MSISVTSAFKDALKGAVDRSQIKVEIYLGAWVDVTSYVEEMSGTLEEVSSLSGGASANTLNLTLINDDGRFSPKYTSGPYYGNLTPNKPIRVSAVYGSESVRMFTGYVSNWIPSAKARTCQVTAEDAARILRRKDITEETVFNSTAPTTGYYLTRVIERAAYLSGRRWDAVTTKTADWTNLDQNGDSVNEITPTYDAAATRAVYTLSGSLVMTLDLVDLLLPCTPLKGKALAVLDQLAKVVDGVIYFDAQGQLVFRSRMYRNDSTLSSVETFTVSSLEDVTAQVNFEDSKWSQLCNRAVVKSTPWAFKTDTSGAVVEEEIPFKGDLFAKYYFTAGERYPDYVADANAADLWCEIPNGIKLFKTSTYPAASNMVLTSVDNSDPTRKTNNIAFQSGYPVFEQNRVKVAFVNNGTGAERIENLTLKAKLMRPIQRCQSIQKNQDSIDLYDQRDKEVSNDFIPTSGACKQLAAWLVEDGREPKTFYTLPVMYGCPWLELGDKITVSETITNTIPTATEAIIRRISWRWTLAAFVFTIEACSPAASFTAGSIPVTVTNVETLNQNNQGQQAGQGAPQFIDSLQAVVGLNNTPAFTNILRSCQSVTAGTTITNARAIAFDGAYLYVGEGGSAYGHEIVKIHPMTGATVSSANSVSTTDSIYDLGVGNSILYLTENVNSTVQCLSLSSFGGGGGFAVKADMSAAKKSPLEVFFIGSKMYLTALNTVTNEVTMNVWNAINTTRQDAPDTVVSLGTAAGGVSPVRGCTDGTYIYVPVATNKLARFDTASNTASTDILAPSLGFSIKCLAHDGVSLWAGGSYGGNNIVTRLVDSSTGRTIDTKTITISGSPAAMLFDGTYIWASAVSKAYQVSPTGALVATWTTGSNNGGYFVFDGFAIWQSGWDHSSLYRLPRLSTGRQF